MYHIHVASEIRGDITSMKMNFNKRNTTLAFYALLVLLTVTLCVFAFLNFSEVWADFNAFISVFLPILYGALIAYLLCPGVKFFERRVFRMMNRHKLYGLSRACSVILVFLIVISSIGLFCWLILPRVLAGYADLQNVSALYIETLKDWIMDIPVGETFFSRYFTRLLEYFVGLLETIYLSVAGALPDVMDVATGLMNIVGDLFLGIILSIYFLLARERLHAQCKKILRAFLNTDKYRVVSRSTRLADKNFGGYIKGQIADAIVIGVLSFLCLMIIGVPYYPLVSTLVGFSSLIPVVGTLIGSIIGAIIVFLTDPMYAIGFVGFMVLLHLINRHMIRPHVIRVGVDASTMFMFAAIIIMTGLIGFWGLLLGVPVFAILYAFLHSAVDKRLSQKGFSSDQLDYYSTASGRELYLEREARRERRKHGEKPEEQEEDFRLKKPDPEPSTESTDTVEITVTKN